MSGPFFETLQYIYSRTSKHLLWTGPPLQKLFFLYIAEYRIQQATKKTFGVVQRATGVKAAGDARDTSPPIFWLGGRQWKYPHQYYYLRSDIAHQY